MCFQNIDAEKNRNLGSREKPHGKWQQPFTRGSSPGRPRRSRPEGQRSSRQMGGERSQASAPGRGAGIWPSSPWEPGSDRKRGKVWPSSPCQDPRSCLIPVPREALSVAVICNPGKNNRSVHASWSMDCLIESRHQSPNPALPGLTIDSCFIHWQWSLIAL